MKMIKKVIKFVYNRIRSAIKWWLIDVVISVITGGAIPPFALMAVLVTAIKWEVISKGLDILQKGLSMWGNILTLKEVIKEQEVIKSSGLDAA